MPRTDNGNYIWIQMFYAALNASGRAGFVMANSASDARGSELEVRKKLIESGAVDVMIAIGSNFFFDSVLVDAIDIERWISHYKIEAARTLVNIFVVGISLAYVTRQPVDGEVHLAEANGIVGLLLSENCNLGGRVFVMVFDEARALYEHATRAASRIEDAPVEWLDNFDDQFDQRSGREELAAFRAFCLRELAEEVFVYLAEHVALDVHLNRRECFQ
jgi:hypothetical protein